MTYSYSHPSSTVDLKAIAIATQVNIFIIPTHPEPDQPRRSAPQVQVSGSAPHVQISPAAPEQFRRCAPQAYVNIFYQSHKSRARSAPQIRPASPVLSRRSRSAPQIQITRLTYLLQIRSVFSSSYRSAPQISPALYLVWHSSVKDSCTLQLPADPPRKFYQPKIKLKMYFSGVHNDSRRPPGAVAGCGVFAISASR